MKTTIITLASIFLFAFSCEGDKKTKQSNSLAEEAIEAIDLNAEDFKGKIDQLLTLEIAAKVSDLPAVDAKKKHSKFSSLESVKYEWKSNRTKTIEITKGNPIHAPKPNSIELSWVKNTTLEAFKHDYHNPTAKEIQKAETAMDKKADELAAEGKATKEQSETATGIAKNSISKFKVEEVPNLGTYAVFVNSGIMGVSTRELKVYYKDLSFTITADLSDDTTSNDKKAIEAAQLIIKQKLK